MPLESTLAMRTELAGEVPIRSSRRCSEQFWKPAHRPMTRRNVPNSIPITEDAHTKMITNERDALGG
jgi:hypothetical protein